MATQLNEDDEPLEIEEEGGEDQPEIAEEDQPEDEPEEEETVSFGDEPEEPEDAPNWAKDLRKRHEEMRRENIKLRQRVALTESQEPDVVVGDKPTLEGCDFDAERYEAERDAWDDRRIKAADQQRNRDEVKRKREDEWGKVQRNYAEGKARLRYADVSEAEAAALSELSEQQQAVIAKHADNPALFIYALGKNPSKLAQIAGMDDPFALTKAMTRMEATLKQTKVTRPPDPSRRVVGKPVASSGNKYREKLEAEARKSGDWSNVIKYNYENRSK